MEIRKGGNMRGSFDLEYFINSVLGIIVYAPVYLIARALIHRNSAQGLSLCLESR